MFAPGNYDFWKTTEPEERFCLCGYDDCDGDHSDAIEPLEDRDERV